MLTDSQFAARIKDYLTHLDQRGPDECWPASRVQIYWESVNKRPTYKRGTHIAYWLAHRKWPTYVEHTCDNPPCRNPAHLLDSDHAANMRSMSERNRTANGQKTHCPQGHSYAEHAGTRHRGNGKTFRVCNRCVLEDSWKRRGGPSAKSQGTDAFPVCPRCGGSWVYYGTQGRRRCPVAHD